MFSKDHKLFEIKVSFSENSKKGKGVILNLRVTELLGTQCVVLTRKEKILALGFVGDKFSVEDVKQDLCSRSAWKKAFIEEDFSPFTFSSSLSLELWGTLFQIKVWEALCKIPQGSTTSYSVVASSIDHPHAQRAVGTAIAQNPISYFIPCHRVLPKTNRIGNYYWGVNLKNKLLEMEEINR